MSFKLNFVCTIVHSNVYAHENLRTMESTKGERVRVSRQVGEFSNHPSFKITIKFIVINGSGLCI